MKTHRRAVATLTAAAMTAAALAVTTIATAPAAQAAPVAVDDASLTWAVNNEVNAGAFAPGTWNLMSAGLIGNPGSASQTLRTPDEGATWSNGAAAGWSNRVGNVTIEDKQADGSYAPTTFQGTRTNAAGAATSGSSQTTLAETRLVLSAGTGTVDPAAGTASISWDGDATVLFYSGMTYFTLSDPELVVEADGDATLSATAGGYATAQDSTTWTALPATEVTLATMSGVDVSETGLSATPAYAGVTYEAGSATPQARTGSSWGAFPQDFVDFQQRVGQGPYWYSTGGQADPRKVAAPLTVAFDAVVPQVTVSRTRFLPSGAQEVTVNGTGFDPADATGTRPPLANRPAGAYVVFGKFAQAWRPSAGAASATRKTTTAGTRWAVLQQDMASVGGPNAGAVELTPQGTFTATVVVDKAAVDAVATDPSLVNYGIYTYAGSGAVAASYETYTPITFADAPSTLSVTAPATTYGAPASATVVVGNDLGATGAVTLTRGSTPVGTANLVGGRATFALGSLPAGSHALTASYGGAVNVAAATASTTLDVARATSSIGVEVTKKVRAAPRKKKGRAQVVVTSPAPGGSVNAVLRKGTRTRTLPAVELVGGRATVSLPKLAAGTWRLSVEYAGTADVAASTDTVKVKVR